MTNKEGVNGMKDMTEEYSLDNGLECGAEDTRPAWAKKIQGHCANWAQIERVKSVVGDVSDDANITLQPHKVRFGDKSYGVSVFLDGKEVGKYSY
ncbi:MAG: hypothetical protein ACKPHM_03010 [Dolichospermum sp.]